MTEKSSDHDLREIRYWLTRFELDELLNKIISQKMKEDGTDFQSYFFRYHFFCLCIFQGFWLLLLLFILSLIQVSM